MSIGIGDSVPRGGRATPRCARLPHANAGRRAPARASPSRRPAERRRARSDHWFPAPEPNSEKWFEIGIDHLLLRL
jgi:hypothetical protein